MAATSSKLTTLETKLNDIFVKRAPALPKSVKDFFVEITPWANLVLVILTIWTLYLLWHWAHLANSAVNYANALNQIYGTNTVVHRLSATVWITLLIIVVQALIYLKAFTPLRARQKAGWDLLFYAALLNIVYGFFVMFTSYGGVSSFIGSLISSAIGFYILFQIRAHYTAKTKS